MSGKPLHGWAGAWRLFWSFLWRQALALLFGSAVLGLVLSTMRKLNLVSGAFLINYLGICTTALMVFSCVLSFKLILSKFDIRLHGSPAEPDRRHVR